MDQCNLNYHARNDITLQIEIYKMRMLLGSLYASFKNFKLQSYHAPHLK